MSRLGSRDHTCTTTRSLGCLSLGLLLGGLMRMQFQVFKVDLQVSHYAVAVVNATTSALRGASQMTATTEDLWHAKNDNSTLPSAATTVLIVPGQASSSTAVPSTLASTAASSPTVAPTPAATVAAASTSAPASQHQSEHFFLAARGRRCTTELWSEHPMRRIDAETRCLQSPRCKGLMFYAAEGGSGLQAESAWYQGCSGRLEATGNSDWDVLLRQELRLAASGAFEPAHPPNTTGQPAPTTEPRTTTTTTPPDETIDVLVAKRRCSIELWMEHDMTWQAAKAKCLGDAQCAGLMFFLPEGGHALSGSAGWYQGCGGGIDHHKKSDWEVVLRRGLRVDNDGKITYDDRGGSHCCAQVPSYDLCANCPEHPDVRQRGDIARHKWDGAGGLGNRVMRYWNMRALTSFRGQPFRADGTDDQVLRHLRKWVAGGQEVNPGLRKAFRKLSRFPGFPGDPNYPHASAAAPWRLFMDTMAQETKDVAQAILDRKDPPSIPPKDVAAVYVRCDIDIVGEAGETGTPEYGLLPHRFVGRRLPPGITKVVILLGMRYGRSKLCPKVIDDFRRYLMGRNLSVELREPGGGTGGTLEDDWAQLTTYRTAFSWPSTFSFTALVGNPNRVFFPFNSGNMVIVEPPLGMQEACTSPHPQWSWTEIDFLPGRELHKLGWARIHEYLNSDSCDTRAVPCIPARESC